MRKLSYKVLHNNLSMVTWPISGRAEIKFWETIPHSMLSASSLAFLCIHYSISLTVVSILIYLNFATIKFSLTSATVKWLFSKQNTKGRWMN